jgi:hypothetical protein
VKDGDEEQEEEEMAEDAAFEHRDAFIADTDQVQIVREEENTWPNGVSYTNTHLLVTDSYGNDPRLFVQSTYDDCPENGAWANTTQVYRDESALPDDLVEVHEWYVPVDDSLQLRGTFYKRDWYGNSEDFDWGDQLWIEYYDGDVEVMEIFSSAPISYQEYFNTLDDLSDDIWNNLEYYAFL